MLNKELFLKYTEDKIEHFFKENIEEQSIYKALNIYDSLTKNFNNIFELLEDWYSLQNYVKYKEMNDNYRFIKYIQDTDLEILKNDIHLSGSLDEDAIKRIKELAGVCQSIHSTRSKIENYITREAKKKFPNLESILGPILCVRMLNMTKSLEKFILLPASTIQMIGAESALFRHLKNNNKKPPKFGFLFQHNIMNNLSPKGKGKLARFMANKIALASRLDYSKSELDKKLYKSIEEKKKSLM